MNFVEGAGESAGSGNQRNMAPTHLCRISRQYQERGAPLQTLMRDCCRARKGRRDRVGGL
ncbi:hypothetical protein BDY21DRAFT_214903 [Lineolata rhizophorae]|uniref:Uncharacterized protein n=1 Tax=Lineolata rhizophorae TaxID=578093 RepID=A0A6A6P2Y6_9PEZI|nr:hypothetical protein BDY21DRAFT_214903 [Lineolata rhizophorae]